MTHHEHTPQEKLVKHLTDVHSIEEQALVQMRRAPRIAGDPKLAQIFEQHLGETEEHEERVRERLTALGAEPSRVKDAAGKAGGFGMIFFARVNPDTPGKLIAHAYSYEHMELAAYELLREVARKAGDKETEKLAKEIAKQEGAMAERLEDCFDAAVDASLRVADGDNVDRQLDKYLADAHAIEQQAVALLQGGKRIAGDEHLKRLFDEHLEETREHKRRLEERLEARGASPSRLQDLALHAGGLGIGTFFAAQPDTPGKLTGFAFAFEHIEAGSYELLRRVAERAGDMETVEAAEANLEEERSMARRLREHFDEAMEVAMASDVAG
jgi:ferritin-like metal-binding protein YciE